MLPSIVLVFVVVAQVLEQAVPIAAASDPTANNPLNDFFTNIATETNGAGIVTVQPNVVTTQTSSTTTPSSTSSSSSAAAASTTLRQAHTTSTLETPSSASTSSPQPSTSGLTTGAKAGIGVGVAIGVLLIAAGAYYFGKREKTEKIFMSPESGNSPTMQGFEEKEDAQPELVVKPELHGQQAPTPELPGSPVLPREAPTAEYPKEASPTHTRNEDSISPL